MFLLSFPLTSFQLSIDRSLNLMFFQLVLKSHMSFAKAEYRYVYLFVMVPTSLCEVNYIYMQKRELRIILSQY